MALDLLGSTSRVEIPYIKVQIGNYTFGIYQKVNTQVIDENGFALATTGIQYPNYIKSLNITKINGQVNTYELSIIYPITPGDDPNFFEKVFSSVSDTRKIIFSYGDMALPTYIYKNEEALITDIQHVVNIKNSSISYTVKAVSSANLLKAGSFTFDPKDIVGPEARSTNGLYKPSDVIKGLLRNQNWGLSEVFYGMNNANKIEEKGLIYSNDAVRHLETFTNVSVFDYLKYLVSEMIPSSSTEDSRNNHAVLLIHDDSNANTDATGEDLGGPYFEIKMIDKKLEYSDAYDIIIGYPTVNIVKDFQIDNNETYSIFYNWVDKLNQHSHVQRIDDDGNWVEEYAPPISSGNNDHITKGEDRTWWTKVTQYPISGSITIKGLLRPATLMSYVRIHVLFYGNEYIDSGLYIVTGQRDSVSERGYQTTLSITRIDSISRIGD